MKKLLLVFLLLIKPIYSFAFNYEINPYGITDKLLIQEGESKLSIEHSQQDRSMSKLALRIDDGEIIELRSGKIFSAILPIGLHKVSISETGAFKPFLEYEVLSVNKTKSLMKVDSKFIPFNSNNPDLFKVKNFIRLTDKGDIFNRNPLSDTRSAESTRNHFRDVSTDFDSTIKFLMAEIEKAKNEPKIIATDNWYTISFIELGLTSDMTRKPNGICHFYLFAPHITKDFLPKFLKIASVIHMHPCKEVLVDLTGPGGNLDASIKVGLYIRLAGWSTTWGGYAVDNRTGYRVCYSACSNIFFSGVKRYSNSAVQLGVHQPSFIVDKVRTCVNYNSYSNEYFRQYLFFILENEGEKLFDELMSIPCEQIRPPIDPIKRKLYTGKITFSGNLVDGFN